MAQEGDRRMGRPSDHFLDECRSVFSDHVCHLREEREQTEGEARIKAGVQNDAGDRLPNPQPLKDRNIITSFGKPIPDALETTPAPKPGLKYSDHPYAPEWARHPSQRISAPPKPEEISFCPSVEQFEDLLWKEVSEDVRVYAIMDGFWAKGLYGRLLASPDISWAHMYQGGMALNNIQDAPFIIALKRGHKLLRWLIEEGWGDGWGMYFTASTNAVRSLYGSYSAKDPRFIRTNAEEIRLGNLTEGDDDPLWLMRGHFRRFTDVEFEDDGRIVNFRYYDPATLRIYLPSCNDNELHRFYGPIQTFYAEGYCEVQSLNQPHYCYIFAMKSKQDKGKRHYIGGCLNLADGTKVGLSRFSVSEELLERQAGPYAVIRTNQRIVFQEQQKLIAEENITNIILRFLTTLNYKINKTFLHKFIKQQINLAKDYSISTQQELLPFCLCSILYEYKNKKVHSELESLLIQKRNQPTLSIEEKLQNLVDKWLKGNVK